MTITSVSTSYLGTAMLPAINQSDAQLAQLEIESATGQHANLGQTLGEYSGYELSLRTTDDYLQTLTTSNALTVGRLSTSSSALTAITTTAQSTLSALVSWSEATTTGVDLGSAGDESIKSLVSYANAAYDNQYVFGGVNSSVPPMSAFSSTSTGGAALLSAFQTQFGFAPSDPSADGITGAQMESFLSGPFAAQFSGANWTTNWSAASSTNTSAEISPDDTIATSTNLNAGGFQQLTQAYAMLSLFGDSQISGDAKQAVVTASLALVNQGLSQITSVGATVGQLQNQVKQADDDMSTQMSLLATQIGGLDNVNPEKVATQLSTLTTQLETAYQATAQLQKLSLAQYLPA